MKCIVAGYSTTFDAIKQMVEERFSMPDTIVVLGYNHRSCDVSELRKEYPGNKIIIYQLEQLYDNKSQWFNESGNQQVKERTRHIKKVLSECDEIWDYSLDNITFLEKLGYQNIKHVPVSYSENLNKRYDVLFYGALNDRRVEFLKHLTKYKLLIITPDIKKYKELSEFMIPSQYGDSLFNYVFRSRVVLNLHYYDSCIQEQVRIFDLLINDAVVISEKSRKNNYPGLIREFETPKEMICQIDSVLNNTISNRYKSACLKRNYKVGAAYNTFYGLELIEESIRSIRNLVDYIVVVHQRVGFSGEKEPKFNQSILDRLGVEVIYVEPKNLLEKRNIGLEYCKKNGCDFIIPLDTDEIYNEAELRDEIDYMYHNDIDTLYSPIRTYYYDREHYFNDTYFVPSVYRINERIFQRGKSSVLCDPVRKMKEGKYKISNSRMHHYSYLIDSFEIKVKNSMMSIGGLSENKKKIYEHLIKWRPGDKALVHQNREDGSLFLSLIPLNDRFKKSNCVIRK